MQSWKVTLIITALVAANAAIANVTITGERTGATPLPSLNLSHDLRQIAYSSARPTLKFPSPLQQTGEIKLPGAFDPSKYSPELTIPCSPLLFRQCGNPEITAWSGAGVSALRFYLGPNVDVATFDSAHQQMNHLLEVNYGANPENGRVDGMSLAPIDDFKFNAGSAL